MFLTNPVIPESFMSDNNCATRSRVIRRSCRVGMLSGAIIGKQIYEVSGVHIVLEPIRKRGQVPFCRRIYQSSNTNWNILCETVGKQLESMFLRYPISVSEVRMRIWSPGGSS